MKRFLLSVFVSIICFLCVSAQKEIYFSNIKVEDIKEQSLNGVEVKLSMNPMTFLQNSGYNRNMYSSLPIYIGYFQEKHISANWTLNLSTGFYNNFTKSPEYEIITDSLNNRYLTYSGTYINSYSLSFGVGIEPRWNWNYLDRAQKGKGKLNSGGFLSFPLVLLTPVLQTPNALYNVGLFPSSFSVSFALLPTIGYRQAISKNLFLEGSLSAGLSSAIRKNYNNQISVSSPSLNTLVNFKAAYTFKIKK
jgi:hypothetical protein